MAVGKGLIPSKTSHTSKCWFDYYVRFWCYKQCYDESKECFYKYNTIVDLYLPKIQIILEQGSNKCQTSKSCSYIILYDC